MAGSTNGNPDVKETLLSLIQEETEGSAFSASLDGWSTNSGTPVCDWEGVTCDEHAVVREINLPAEGLSGTIPSELGLLSELEVLNLKKNMLRGSIPQEVANLKKLVTLDLTECFLTGTLPQRFESPRLNSLLLANNAISGKFFEGADDDSDSPHLQSIKNIRMENNLLTGTLHSPTITKMPHLQLLSLSDNDLSGLIPGEGLGSLPDLHYLYLDANHFVGPLHSNLAQVGKANILELWVQDNALSGTVPASYVRFDQLHDFFIDGNRLTGALPPDLCGPEINADFFENLSPNVERNYCDSIACPAGSVALEGIYPCTTCPGGEVARLKNRYLGQAGKCSEYSEREILEIFYKATTKGGAWKGVSDWDDKSKPVCAMTGITCDAQDHVVGINLKNRGLQGHIPDKIGLLPYLESLDVSDNSLMGYVPSDLQWTSITKLDVSGNKIRGMLPPLLCKMAELNGNGKDSVFHCDRIACPEGTFNSFGFHHGVDGDPCQPCDSDSPFIAQKRCTRPLPLQALKVDGGSTTQIMMETSEQMGVASKVGIGMLIGASVISVLVCWLVKRVTSSPRHKYRPAMIKKKMSDVLNNSFLEDDNMDDYSFRDYQYEHSNYQDDSNSEEVESDEDSTEQMSWARRSAVDFIRENQGIALSRREKIKRSVSDRMSGELSGELNQRARKTVSNINVGARRRWHSHALSRANSDVL